MWVLRPGVVWTLSRIIIIKKTADKQKQNTFFTLWEFKFIKLSLQKIITTNLIFKNLHYPSSLISAWCQVRAGHGEMLKLHRSVMHMPIRPRQSLLRLKVSPPLAVWRHFLRFKSLSLINITTFFLSLKFSSRSSTPDMTNMSASLRSVETSPSKARGAFFFCTEWLSMFRLFFWEIIFFLLLKNLFWIPVC